MYNHEIINLWLDELQFLALDSGQLGAFLLWWLIRHALISGAPHARAFVSIGDTSIKMLDKRSDISRHGPIQFPPGGPTGINQPRLPGRVSRTRCGAARMRTRSRSYRDTGVFLRRVHCYTRDEAQHAGIYLEKGAACRNADLPVGGSINSYCAKIHERRTTSRRIAWLNN